MLAVPLLVGVAASGPVAAHLLLAVAAVAGYLALATGQEIVREQGRRALRATRGSPPQATTALGASLATYGAVTIAAAVPLVLLAPPLLAAVPILGGLGGASLLLAQRVRGRPLAGRLLEAAPALLLTPAAAVVAGPASEATVAAASGVSAAYLVGTLLVVRAAIRERGNTTFAVGSIAWHLGATAAAAVLLPLPYALAGSLLTIRAAAVPVVQARLARREGQLRPVRLGMVELVAASVVVIATFAARP